MADFLIRDLSEDVMGRLRARAATNGRSVQAEIQEILTRSVKMTREETFARWDELRERFAGRKFMDAAELIREDRDNR
ncbi:MAG: hypothetical protein C0418_01705 [Coriobacteriaceae bacterium]|nr:hypothetical protein [Coriobacteriaceae bacterium]